MATWYKFVEFGVSFYETAPLRFIAQTTINAPPEAVFQALEDESLWPAWFPVFRSVEWTSPKPLRFDSTRKITMRHRRVIEERCIRWVANERLSFMIDRSNMARLLKGGTDFELTPTEEGTHLRWTIAIQPRGFLAQLSYLARPGGRVAMHRALRKLKKIVEKRAKS